MTAVNCPMCQLRFTNRNERDWHLRNEHEHPHPHPPTIRSLEWPHHPATGSDRNPDLDGPA